jgi:hypothetical protein
LGQRSDWIRSDAARRCSRRGFDKAGRRHACTHHGRVASEASGLREGPDGVSRRPRLQREVTTRLTSGAEKSAALEARGAVFQKGAATLLSPKCPRKPSATAKPSIWTPRRPQCCEALTLQRTTRLIRGVRAALTHETNSAAVNFCSSISVLRCIYLSVCYNVFLMLDLSTRK